MTDKVIVTLRFMGQEFDMELPAKAEMEQLKPMIAAALKQRCVEIGENAAYMYNGYTLKGTDTLLETGVWDGSYLDIC